MKKGRHRRFEEARALKRSDTGLSLDDSFEPGERLTTCDECGADPGDPHAGWCRAEAEADEYADD